MKIHLYEKVWMVISTLMLMVFLIAIATSVFAAGIQLPDRIGKVDPRTVAQTPPFNEPGVRELAPGQYEVYMLAQIWSFTPREIRVPAGSTVTLYATSKDVIHGFLLEGTDINIMLIPGQVSQATFRLEKPGEYRFICHEYCGIGHQGMTGKIIVE